MARLFVLAAGLMLLSMMSLDAQVDDLTFPRLATLRSPVGDLIFSDPAYSSDGKLLAALLVPYADGQQAAVGVWDARTSRFRLLIRPKDDAPRSIAFRSGTHELALQVGEQIDVYDADTGRRKRTAADFAEGRPVFSPSGNFMAVAQNEGQRVTVFNAAGGGDILGVELPGPGSASYALNDGRLAVGWYSQNADKIETELRIYELLSAHKVAVARLPGRLYGMAWTPDQHRVIAWGEDAITVWDSGLRHPKRVGGGTVSALAQSSDGRLAAAIPVQEAYAWVFDLRTGRSLGRTVHGQEWALGVAFHPTRPEMAACLGHNLVVYDVSRTARFRKDEY